MKIRQAWLIVTLALVTLLAPLFAAAQQSRKVPRIGCLLPGSPSTVGHLVEAFRQGLRELGYVEGQNIAIECRWAEGRVERLPDLAAELVRLNVDVIVTAATPAIQAAKQATKTIPIVMAVGTAPMETGLVASLARPGGNITGLSLLAPEIVGKQLQLLKEAVPKFSRVAVLRNPANPGHAPLLREAQVAAQSLGVQLQILEARGADELDSAFEAMTRERAGALLVPPDPLFLFHRTRLADLAAKRRLPTMYGLREHTEAGGLMAYAANLSDMWRRSAIYVGA